MDSNPKDFARDGRYPTPEEVEKIIERHPELHKPLMFANHQKKFVAFTWISCVVVTLYFVFWQEFPQEEHVFSPIRRYVNRLKDQYFKVNIEDDEAVKNRIQELKDRIEAKKIAEANLEKDS